MCKDLLAGNRVTYFWSLSTNHGNYSGGELQELRKDQWVNRSDEYTLKWSDDQKKWWDNQSDEFMLEWSDDRKKWWADQSDEFMLE